MLIPAEGNRRLAIQTQYSASKTSLYRKMFNEPLHPTVLQSCMKYIIYNKEYAIHEYLYLSGLFI